MQSQMVGCDPTSLDLVGEVCCADLSHWQHCAMRYNGTTYRMPLLGLLVLIGPRGRQVNPIVGPASTFDS